MSVEGVLAIDEAVEVVAEVSLSGSSHASKKYSELLRLSKSNDSSV